MVRFAPVCRRPARYPAKLIAFMQTELIDKGCRNGDRPYMLNTLKLHVAAVTDLWKQQVDLGITPHPKPRSANVQAMLNGYSEQTYDRNRESYQDRAAGSIFNGYNTEDMLKISRATLSRQDSYGDRIQGSYISYWATTCSSWE
ncbi:hypothetical protein V1525DRAFT_430591 [Lipomyces kononenkoae]|uniref:Uncharacterized protein n=1 Tax=Lipomyces kononenkoae TaxID=34357 RepID=A0ACC3T7Q0_LIPKO